MRGIWMLAKRWRGTSDKMQTLNIAIKQSCYFSCIVPILVPLHAYRSYSLQPPYFYKLKECFFLKATTSLKSLYV